MKRKKKTRSSQPSAQLTPQQVEQQRHEKVMRLAHHILTKTIEPAKLKLEEVIDILVILAKAVVLSNTSEDDSEDRSGMIEWIEEHFMEGLNEIDPLAEIPHVWIIPPQGLITEPVGILWTGARGEDEDEDEEDIIDVDADDEGDGDGEGARVQVMLGAELELLRAEIAEDPDGIHVIEGVEGLAAIDPTWDGEATATCENPQCGKVHDVHLRVAENLFQQAVERRRLTTAPN